MRQRIAHLVALGALSLTGLVLTNGPTPAAALDVGWVSVGGATSTSTVRVNVLRTDGDVLYAGGMFDHVGGIEATNVARYDLTGWHAVGAHGTGPDAATAVSDIEIVGTDVYVAQTGGIWRLDTTTDTWHDTHLADQADADLLNPQITWLDDGGNPPYLMAGGGRASANNCGLWMLLDTGWTDTGGSITLHNGADHCELYELVTYGDTAYLGGTFDAADVMAYSFALWDYDGLGALAGATSEGGVLDSRGASGDTIPVGTVRSIVQNPVGGDFYLGGTFDTIDGVSDLGAHTVTGTQAVDLARYVPGDVAYYPVANSSSVYQLASYPDGDDVYSIAFVSGSKMMVTGFVHGADGTYFANYVTDIDGGGTWDRLGGGLSWVGLSLVRFQNSTWFGGLFQEAYRDVARTPVANSGGVVRWGEIGTFPSVTTALIDGIGQQGNTLTVTAEGVGVPAPTITLQWYRCATTPAFTVPPPGCTLIADAHGTTYVLGAADVGKRIAVVVSAQNQWGLAQHTMLFDGVVAATPTTTAPATTPTTAPVTTAPATSAPATTAPDYVLPATGGRNTATPLTAVALLLMGMALVRWAARRPA